MLCRLNGYQRWLNFNVSPDSLLQVTDTLDGEEIIPGFSMPVANLFVELEF
ncbi:MAG: hypothetical protein VKJ64_02845 [Leptolyngbyaceae bacterium]|nr:hypothetical protein [Leptolyngbyaceae bacterium]